jgi:hypothetical protein
MLPPPFPEPSLAYCEDGEEFIESYRTRPMTSGVDTSQKSALSDRRYPAGRYLKLRPTVEGRVIL